MFVGNATVKTLIASQSIEATTNFTAVDVSEYDGPVAVILNSSAGTGTDPTMDVKLQSSATSGGTYADIAGAVFTQVTDAAGSTQAISFNPAETSKYVRAVATLDGTTPAFNASLQIIGEPKYVG